MAELHHERCGFLVDERPVTAGQVEQQHDDHAPIMTQKPPGVVVPPALCAAVARLAVIGLDVLSRRDGGLRPAPGLPALLRDLSMADSGHAFATIGETRWVDVEQASRLAGVSERSTRRLAANGRLTARRHGRRGWLVDADSARDYGRGRRRGTTDDDP